MKIRSFAFLFIVLVVFGEGESLILNKRPQTRELRRAAAIHTGFNNNNNSNKETIEIDETAHGGWMLHIIFAVILLIGFIYFGILFYKWKNDGCIDPVFGGRLLKTNSNYKRSLYLRFNKTMRSDRFKRMLRVNSTKDLHSHQFKRRMYMIVSRGLRGIVKKELISKYFIKEYPRALHFAIEKAKHHRRGVGVGSMLKYGREYLGKYHHFDIMKHKLEILPMFGKAMANLSRFT